MNEEPTPIHPSLPPSVNFHLWKPCNMACRFCFATFSEPGLHPPGHLREHEARALVERLADELEVEKLTFAGGEPTLCPFLPTLVRAAKERGLVTVLVTNGSRLGESHWILGHDRPLDWLTLSIDSLDPETNIRAGRAERRGAQNLDAIVHFVDRARANGVRIKLNTVVHRLNVDEDLTPLLDAIRPERWKVLQVLPVSGQSDCDELLIDEESFAHFVARHRSELPAGIQIVPETNAQITGTYAMVDPAGRFFDNTRGHLHYSDPILEVGVQKAWSQVSFSPEGFAERGGRYEFRSPELVPIRPRRRPFVVIAGVSGAGKDAAAGFLTDRGWSRVAIADPLKRGLKVMLGLNDEQLWGSTRNVPLEGFSVSPRRLLQDVSSLIRTFSPGVWTHRWRQHVEAELASGKCVVTTDVRTPDELVTARKMGALSILVRRPGAGAPGDLAKHPDETGLLGISDTEFDAVIENEGSLAELEAKMLAAVRRAGLEDGASPAC